VQTNRSAISSAHKPDDLGKIKERAPCLASSKTRGRERNDPRMNGRPFRIVIYYQSSFWVWAAPSTPLTLWSLLRNWVLILKELRSLPPSSMCTLWTLLLNLSIPDVPFPVLLSTLIRSWFQAKPATLLIPTDFPFLFAVEELYGTRYQSGSFSLNDVGSGFHCLRRFFCFLFSWSMKSWWLEREQNNSRISFACRLHFKL